MPMMIIGVFLMIEVMHINEHLDMESGDAHGYCGQKQWVKKLQEDAY